MSTNLELDRIVYLFGSPRTEPLDRKEKARTKAAELAKSAAQYDYDLNHPYSRVVSYKHDCFLETAQPFENMPPNGQIISPIFTSVLIPGTNAASGQPALLLQATRPVFRIGAWQKELTHNCSREMSLSLLGTPRNPQIGDFSEIKCSARLTAAA